MTKKHLPILIIGGGIGGATTAIALAAKGIDSIVIEQAPQFREIGGGIQFCPNVFKMFDYLGIKKQIIDIAFFPENLVYMDGVTGKEYSRIPLGKSIENRFKYPYGVFHRAEALNTLVNECKKSPHIKLVTSAKIVDVEERGDKVFATTEDKVIYEGEALIGCDGLWSVVRDHVIGKKEPRVANGMSYRGVVPLDQIPEYLRPNDVVHWHRPNSHLTHYPISSKGFFNVLAEIESEVPHGAHDTNGNPEELDAMFAGSPPQILELLKYINKSRMWMVMDREPLTNWTNGRLTLLGDAAHPTLPHMTQGAGMAIEDAVVLAEYIKIYERDYASAFKAYQEERYLRTAYVQTMSKAYVEVHHACGVQRDLRNYVFSKLKLDQVYDLLGFLYSGIEVPKGKL